MKVKSEAVLKGLFVVLVFAAVAYAAQPDPAGLDDALGRAADAGLTEQQMNQALGIGYRFKLGENEVIAFLGQLARASRDNLPVAPIMSKMEEGLAKHVDPAAIHRALDQRLARYRTANRFVKVYETNSRKKLDRRERERAVTRIGDLLAAGLPIDALRHMHRSFPQSELHALIEASTFKIVMKQSRIKDTIADEIVHTGLANHRFRSFPLELAQTVRAARQHNIADETIGRMCRGVLAGRLSLEHARQAMGFGRRAADSKAGASHGGGKGRGGAHGNAGPGSGNGGGGHGGGPGGGGPGGGGR